MNKYNTTEGTGPASQAKGEKNDIFIKTNKKKENTKDANTLIFVNKQEPLVDKAQRDQLSLLLSLNIKPTDYILSKKAVEGRDNHDEELIEADSTIKFSQMTN